MRTLLALSLLLVMVSGCASPDKAPGKINISLNFQGQFPEMYTCLGEDINPEVRIHASPGIKQISLLLYDPDARDFVHWKITGIRINRTLLIPENVSMEEFLESHPEAKVWENSFGTPWYRGPCPPSGIHRYVLRVCGDRTCAEVVRRFGKA